MIPGAISSQRTPCVRRPTRRKILSKLFFLATLVALAACAGGGDAEPPEDRARLIDDYVRTITPFAVPDPGRAVGTPSPSTREGNYSCSSYDVAETRQYDRLVAFAANSEALWPGSLVAGSSLQNGQLAPIALRRAPMSYSISIGNLQGAKSMTLDEPKLSSFRESLYELLSAELEGATPANLYSEIEEVYSEEQLALALGITASWSLGVASVGASFDYSSEDVRSRFLVKYTQSYYTVDVDPPGFPSDYLAADVTVEDVERRIPADDPPLYVSSITFGRMVIFTFESEYSADEMEAALSFAYSGGANVEAEAAAAYRSIMNNARINAYILGGSGADAARSIDNFEALMSFIKDGGDFTPESPGAPIAYKLAYLRDSDPARVSLTEDYTVKECTLVSQRVRVVLEGIEVVDTDDEGDNLEIYGAIGAADQTLLERDSEHAIEVDEGQVWPPGGPISEVVLDTDPGPGAVLDLEVSLFDRDGFLDNDDSIGTEVLSVPFESGWNRSVDMYLSGDGTVKVKFRIEAIL